jgi:hypothetical protein
MKKWTIAFIASICAVMLIAAPALAAEQAKTQSQDRVCVEDGSCPEECVQAQTQTQTRLQLKSQVQTPTVEPLKAQPQPMVQTHVRVQLRIGNGDSENAPEWAKKTACANKRILKHAALNLGSD